MCVRGPMPAQSNYTSTACAARKTASIHCPVPFHGFDSMRTIRKTRKPHIDCRPPFPLPLSGSTAMCRISLFCYRRSIGDVVNVVTNVAAKRIVLQICCFHFIIPAHVRSDAERKRIQNGRTDTVGIDAYIAASVINISIYLDERVIAES